MQSARELRQSLAEARDNKTQKGRRVRSEILHRPARIQIKVMKAYFNVSNGLPYLLVLCNQAD